MTRAPSLQTKAILELLQSDAGISSAEMAQRLKTSKKVIRVGIYNLRHVYGFKIRNGYSLVEKGKTP